MPMQAEARCGNRRQRIRSTPGSGGGGARTPTRNTVAARGLGRVCLEAALEQRRVRGRRPAQEQAQARMHQQQGLALARHREISMGTEPDSLWESRERDGLWRRSSRANGNSIKTNEPPRSVGTAGLRFRRGPFRMCSALLPTPGRPCGWMFAAPTFQVSWREEPLKGGRCRQGIRKNKGIFDVVAGRKRKKEEEERVKMYVSVPPISHPVPMPFSGEALLQVGFFA